MILLPLDLADLETIPGQMLGQKAVVAQPVETVIGEESRQSILAGAPRPAALSSSTLHRPSGNGSRKRWRVLRRLSLPGNAAQKRFRVFALADGIGSRTRKTLENRFRIFRPGRIARA